MASSVILACSGPFLCFPSVSSGLLCEGTCPSGSDPCSTCQRAKNGPTADVVMQPLQVVPPWHTVQVDLLFMTPSARGHNYVLTLRDCGSHFTHLVALLTKTAAEVSNAILTIFCQYGMPSKLLSDSGSEFCNTLMDDLLARVHINRATAAPESHRTVGLVERANAEIRKYFRLFSPDDDWDLALPAMMHSFNSAFCISIGMTPG